VGQASWPVRGPAAALPQNEVLPKMSALQIVSRPGHSVSLLAQYFFRAKAAPAANITNITNGYNAEQNGTACSPTAGG
jgi:hypothetical protein